MAIQNREKMLLKKMCANHALARYRKVTVSESDANIWIATLCS